MLFSPEEFRIMKMQNETLLQNQQTIIDALKTLKADIIDEIKAYNPSFSLAAQQPPTNEANSNHVVLDSIPRSHDDDLKRE